MKFKHPRDPNTDPKLFTIRKLTPADNIGCQVGRGECSNLAVESQDDGTGHEFFLCAQHLEEYIAVCKLVNEMTPNQLAAFDRAIQETERQG